MIKDFIKIFIPDIFWAYRKNRQYSQWIKDGRPIPPPPIAKQKIISQFRDQFSYKTFIETGTYLGDMIYAQKNNFDKIYSIELSDELYRKAKKRFKNDKNIFLVHGDSGKLLAPVLSSIDEPTIFWLDGHYSGGITAKGESMCPIFGELDAILSNKSFQKLILIDDARLFVGEDDYPTLSEIREYFEIRDKTYSLEVKDDMIICSKR